MSASSDSLTLMNAKAFLHTGLARGITPEPSTVLFLPAAAAAERYLRRRRPDGQTVGFSAGWTRTKRGRGEKEEEEGKIF